MQSSQDQEVSQKEAEEEVTTKPLPRQQESPQLVCLVGCVIFGRLLFSFIGTLLYEAYQHTQYGTLWW